MIKKILKWLAIIAIVLVVVAIIAIKVMSKPLPTGETGPAAEALAQEVLAAVNHSALEQTDWVSWTFPGGHAYVWHVTSNYAQISFGGTTVKMNLDEQTGKVYRSGTELAGSAADKAIKKAWSYWCNDSWWLIAPHKVMDAGTTRSVVDVSDRYPDHRGLLVQYASGGVTPGDAYLWLVDQTGQPTGYEMWVDIIPIGGLYASWADYQALHSGAMVSVEHNMGIAKMGLGPVRSGQTCQAVGLTEDIFAGM